MESPRAPISRTTSAPCWKRFCSDISNEFAEQGLAYVRQTHHCQLIQTLLCCLAPQLQKQQKRSKARSQVAKRCQKYLHPTGTFETH